MLIKKLIKKLTMGYYGDRRDMRRKNPAEWDAYLERVVRIGANSEEAKKLNENIEEYRMRLKEKKEKQTK